jgi:aryl-alcohol dehydrogenase-like predicted oxidoreductase
LGRTDIKISTLGLGNWAFAGDSFWGNQDDEDSINTVSTALDCGMNFIDTAEGYGRSESVLGKALKGKRGKAVIATKAQWGSLKKENLIDACEKSLERLDTEYIDLYYIHWPNEEAPLEYTMEIMEKLKEQGKIRSIGISNFGLKYLNQLSAIGKIDLVEVNQLPYSLLWRTIEYEIKQATIEKNIGIVCYSSLAQGLLTGLYNNVNDVPDHLKVTRFYNCKHMNAEHGEKGCEKEVFNAIKKIRKICEELSISMPEIAVSWLLHQKGVTSVLTGARKPDEIIQNVKAAETKLDDEILQKLTNITEKVKEKLGNNSDMWVNKENSRYIKGFPGIKPKK